jgi:hypothetical protein
MTAKAYDMPTSSAGRAAVAPWKQTLPWRKSEMRFWVDFCPTRTHQCGSHLASPTSDRVRPFTAVDSHFRADI